MKNKLFIAASIVIITISSYGQDTIPNHNFENWINIYHPVNWETTNLLLPPGFTNCAQSSNSYTGDYAISLETIDVDGMLVPGVATIGKLELFSTKGGIPYTAKPEALKGFYLHPTSGDEILIGVEFFKEGNAIGGGLWTSTDSVSDYTPFYIPITFYSYQTPDTLNITIVTDQFKEGSSVLIDGLEMEFQTTQINETTNQRKTRCYPNPSSGIITIEQTLQEDLEIQIYSMDGKLVKQVHISSKLKNLDLTDNKPGIYSAVFIYGDEVLAEKIILQ